MAEDAEGAVLVLVVDGDDRETDASGDGKTDELAVDEDVVVGAGDGSAPHPDAPSRLATSVTPATVVLYPMSRDPTDHWVNQGPRSRGFEISHIGDFLRESAARGRTEATGRSHTEGEFVGEPVGIVGAADGHQRRRRFPQALNLL